MGSGEFSKPKEKTHSEKFVEWLNAIDFKDDPEMTVALFEMRDEIQTRLAAMEEEKDVNEAESKGSAP